MTMFSPHLAVGRVLDVLCPMHVQIGPNGRIFHIGPTLAKLCKGGYLLGADFLDVFDFQRPRDVTTLDDLSVAEARKLQLTLRTMPQNALQAVAVFDPREGGMVLNLSFGIGVIDAVRDHGLNSSDFAPTDLTVEMLFLVEAKTAVLNESRNLNQRLQVARNLAEEQAYSDPLTGLKNRRALAKTLLQHIADRSAYAYLQLDLDLFKAVNDRLGHAAGDEVLRRTAETLSQLTRRDDLVARIGGDEFAVIFNGALPRERLAFIAAQMIKALEKPITFEGQTCNISASIGITLIAKGQEITSDEVMRQADHALYHCKQSGRGRYAFYEDIQQEEVAARRGIEPLFPG